jgi:subtilase family serine protease
MHILNQFTTHSVTHRMTMRQLRSRNSAVARVLFFSLNAAILSACGGPDSGTSAAVQAPVATQTYSTTLAAPAADSSVAQPTFHLAPVILDEPDDTDRSEPMSSSAVAPRRAAVSPEFAQLSTRRLTRQVMEQVRDTGMAPESAWAQGTTTDPMTTASTVTVYTPAQIRAAYGLPALAGTASSLTSAQAAQFGAGQTIYLIDAQSDPNVAAELASFDSKFGLPGCTVTAIAASAGLPLAAAPATGCALSIVYSTTSGTMTATAPAYSSGWATEIALDVQWAHATAPYARIILIEAPDASVTSLSAAVQLANQMGPGVVSQSFGAAEGSWTSGYDANFSVANMTYLAAAGDAGAEVEWPAVSSHVLAVAGTSLSYSGTGPRTETVWSGTGGGLSAYVATPAYQSLAVPGLAAPAHRAVSDVTFNADPNTGQYLAIIAQGSTSVGWYSAGGTSLATPQWAGIIAVANALRAQSAVAPIGASQATLYGLATQAGSYAVSFLDVTKGSDGSCTSCNAGVGYDLPSGLGSPNVASLLAALSAQPPATAPVVSAATVSGKVATALSFSITATDAHALTYSLTGAPAGMSVNASIGVVTWSAPILGTYSVIAHALDAKTGLSGQGTINVSIVAPKPPQVAGGSVTGTAQTALTFTTQVTDANVATYSLSGAPSGMSVSTAGVVNWASPLAGTYSVTVIAHDATTGLTGQGVYTVTITAQKAPTVPPASIAGTVGKALSFSVNANATNPLTYSLTGAPLGMTIASTGTFGVTVTAQDTKTGLTGKGVYTISITQSGPVISATSLTGVAGQAFTGSITFTDSAGSVLSISISGVPSGMSFTVSGNVLTAKWASPVTGNYSLQVTVIDTNKLTGVATIPVTITAH